MSILVEKNGIVHVVELLFDKTYDGADDTASLFLHGLVTEEYIRNGRTREVGMSFFPVSSGFRWLSDLERGIVLEGEIEGIPALPVFRLQAETEWGSETQTAKGLVSADEVFGLKGENRREGDILELMLRNELIECHTVSGKSEEGLFLIGLQEVSGATEKASPAESDNGKGGIFGAEIYLDTGGEPIEPGIVT